MLFREEAKCIESPFGVGSAEMNEASMHRHLTCEIRRDTSKKVRVLKLGVLGHCKF